MTPSGARLLLAAASASLGACLTTPDAVPAIDGATIDAAVPDTGIDAERSTGCAVAGACEQLLAIGLWHNEAGGSNSVTVYRRDAADGSWDAIPVGNTPDFNISDLAWADCCGTNQQPDQIPDLLIGAWNALHLVQLRRDGAGFSTVAAAAVEGSATPGLGTEALWFDYDGDGARDAITGFPTLRWHRKVPLGWDSPLAIDNAQAQLATGNWDDDPELEVVVADIRLVGDGGRGIAVLDRGASGGGAFVPIKPDWRGPNVMWCDVSHDDGLDLIALEYGGLLVYPNRGSALNGNWLDMDDFTEYDPIEQVNPPMVCGDIDGDGEDDVVFASASGIRAILHGATNHTALWDPATVSTEATVALDLALGDVDHDGYPELFVTLADEPPTGDVVKPVAYLIPNRTTIAGQLAIGTPEVLLEGTVDAMSIAWVEFPTPAL